MSVSQNAGAKASSHFDAVIVGAGFSGLYQLHLLRDKLGRSVRVLEAAGGIGGTWYWNRYPGARCDSESHYYCYSFSRELQQEWRWSERYPEHPEIRRYLNYVAERFNLLPDIQLNTKVMRADFNDESNRWVIQTESGEQFEATYLVTAVGCLSTANVPNIAGLDDFGGDWYHTGHWPHEGVNLAGKRVGLVGTGSTGIQATPVIAEQAEHLTVFQRTANYSVPARNRPLDDAMQAWIAGNHDEIRLQARRTTNGHPFDIPELSALDVSDAERAALYEAAWERGGLRFRATFKDLITNREANETASEFIRDKIRSIVKDPATAEKLVPHDHLYATKRPPIDTNYFETFNRDNVALVDLKADPIDRIVKEGIRTQAGTHPLDVIVFATGFDALTGPLFGLNVHGSDGVALKDVWADGPRTYLGLQTPGFPNLFTITGPGSPSVLTNMPVAIEQHAEWIADCIAHMRDKGASRIEATREATEKWVAHVNEAAEATLLPMASSSWYLGANVPGKPKVFMPYAGGLAHYRQICADVAANHYDGFAIS